MKEKYLPIGTVVLLKGGRKRAMITGFCSVAQENQEKIYDYSGCVYPEGYLSSNQVCLFDHEQIDKIFFLGFEDEEEKKELIKLLAIQMKKDLNNWNKEGVEDQKIVDDLREYSNGAIDLKVEDLRLGEPRTFNNQRKQNNNQRKQNNQKKKQH